jgi:Flp pilus assembly protein TadD
VDENALSVDRMYTDIEWALSQGLSAGDLVPMVQRLMQRAEPHSPHAHYAMRQLAELIVRKEPFRAARLAKEVLRYNPEDDRALAVLGLACLLMGHYRMAERAYRMALALVPHCPWYAHNLGHLLDVIMGRPEEAVPMLNLARRALPHEPEIASSYAHALYRAGRTEEAWKNLLESVDGNHARAHEIRESWLNQPKPGEL